MTSKQASFILVVPLLVLSCMLARGVHAATLTLVSENKTVNLGDDASVTLYVDTEDESINAVQGTISFPTNIFEVSKIDTEATAFNFWIEEPTVSAAEGIVTFTGGTSKGVSGKSLAVLKLMLKARGAGLGEFGLSNAVVTASDGKGTNVLSYMQGTSIAVGAEAKSVPTSTPAVLPQPAIVVIQPQPVIQPQIVERIAVPGKQLPITPLMNVPLYPDVSRWYNQLGDVIALWGVPDDITKIAASMNQNPNTVPTVAEKELTTGKNFGTIKEGVWYIHVRFKNTIGWGETVHYKVSVDATPPLPFEVKIDAAASDNPSPYITFETRDALSGVFRASVFVDGEVINSATTTAVLAPQSPGTHTVLARIFDSAGNSVEDDQKFEVLPLPTPRIEFISESIAQDEPLFVSGTAIPNASVDIRIVDNSQQEVFKSTVHSDNSGNWKITADKVFPIGKYALTALVRDERRAISASSLPAFFKVRPRTILTLGKYINMGWFEVFIIILMLIAAGAGICAWWYVTKKNTREAYRIIVSRDIEKFSVKLLQYVKEFEENEKLPEPSRSADRAVSIGRMKQTIAKVKKYIIDDEIKKLK